MEDDRSKGLRLEEGNGDASLDSLVRAYWEMTPDTPSHLKTRFIEHVLAGERRSQELLSAERRGPKGDLSEHWLDLGCGTGEYSVVAARAGMRVTGLDVAFRWLVVARRRAALAATAVRFICGNAERLPFPQGAFSRVVSLGLLEHCRRPSDVLAEVRRVLKPGGIVVIRTVNRFSLLPEPHVGIWGVGFLPHRWAQAYVHWRTGQHYLHHRPLSTSDLGRLMRTAGFSDIRVLPARLVEDDRARLPRPLQALADVYEAARRSRVAPLLASVSPLLDVRATA
jgi:ubiquinone/menaquinone biosynthesis C-methylase UbiE